MFPALQHRNFRLLWLGMLVSFAGTAMQSAAILWHVSLLAPEGRRALALGMVGLVNVVPIVTFAMLSGVVADAVDRRRLLILTQSVMAILAAVLAVITFRGVSSLWPIYLLAALTSAATAFEPPSRQALVPALVPRHHLPNALSLNTTMFQIASLGGPALGGIVIATGGVAWAYAANALSFLFVIGSLIAMRDVPAVPLDQRSKVTVRAALEGLRFVYHSHAIRGTILLDFFATFFSSATALLPIFAQDILQVGARGYGWLYAAPSAGALVAGALMVPTIERIRRRGAVLIAAVAAYGAATVLFGLSQNFWLSLLCLAATGFADTIGMVLRQVIRHLEVPDYIRGRMTGVNMVFAMGGPQLGELEAGLVAHWLGAPLSVITGGIGCLVATAWIAAVTPALRHYHAGRSPAAVT